MPGGAPGPPGGKGKGPMKKRKGRQPKGKAKGQPGAGSHSAGNTGAETCPKYNNGQCREPCPDGRRHVCSRCGKNHPAIRCNKGKGKGK